MTGLEIEAAVREGFALHFRNTSAARKKYGDVGSSRTTSNTGDKWWNSHRHALTNWPQKAKNIGVRCKFSSRTRSGNAGAKPPENPLVAKRIKFRKNISGLFRTAIGSGPRASPALRLVRVLCHFWRLAALIDAPKLAVPAPSIRLRR